MRVRRLVIGGATQADIHILTKEIGFPGVKTLQVDVPGANGVLDLSTALTEGEPRYANREVVFGCVAPSGELWDAQRIYGALWHGQVLDVTTDDQTESFWRGRASLSEWTEDATGVGFKLTLDAEPFRLSASATTLTTTAGDAPGVPLTFDAGIMPVSPLVSSQYAGVIIADEAGRTWTTTGQPKETLPGFVVSGPTALRLVGTGSVQFVYREGTF